MLPVGCEMVRILEFYLQPLFFCSGLCTIPDPPIWVRHRPCDGSARIIVLFLIVVFVLLLTNLYSCLSPWLLFFWWLDLQDLQAYQRYPIILNHSPSHSLYHLSFRSVTLFSPVFTDAIYTYLLIFIPAKFLNEWVATTNTVILSGMGCS